MALRRTLTSEVQTLGKCHGGGKIKLRSDATHSRELSSDPPWWGKNELLLDTLSVSQKHHTVSGDWQPLLKQGPGLGQEGVFCLICVRSQGLKEPGVWCGRTRDSMGTVRQIQRWRHVGGAIQESRAGLAGGAADQGQCSQAAQEKSKECRPSSRDTGREGRGSFCTLLAQASAIHPSPS